MFKYVAVLLMLTTLVACTDITRIHMSDDEAKTARSLLERQRTLCREKEAEELHHQTMLDEFNERQMYINNEHNDLVRHLNVMHVLGNRVYDIDYQHGDLILSGSH